MTFLLRKKQFWQMCLLGTAISLLLIVSPSLALGEYISPGDVKITTAKYLPQQTDFAEGVYFYDIDWQGIPVAEAKIKVKRYQLAQGPYVRVSAEAKTLGVIAFFYKLRHRSEGFFRADNFHPLSFFTRQNENSRKRYRQIVFTQNGTILASRWKNGKLKDKVEFNSGNLTLDPLSATFLARSLPVEVGSKVSVDVFNGKHRYLIEFKVVKLESIYSQGKKRNAFKVIPTVKKLTDSEGEKKLDRAAIWVAADKTREILKLESKVYVGKVNAKLNKFVPDRNFGPNEPLPLIFQANLEGRPTA